MATKIKNWFMQSLNHMIEARQQSVNQKIASGCWSHLQ